MSKLVHGVVCVRVYVDGSRKTQEVPTKAVTHWLRINKRQRPQCHLYTNGVLSHRSLISKRYAPERLPSVSPSDEERTA